MNSLMVHSNRRGKLIGTHEDLAWLKLVFEAIEHLVNEGRREITGSGVINIRAEGISIELDPRNKDKTRFCIRGTFGKTQLETMETDGFKSEILERVYAAAWKEANRSAKMEVLTSIGNAM